MPAKKKTTSSKTAKKTVSKEIRAKFKKKIPTPIEEAVKGFKESQKVTLSLTEVEAMLDDAFDNFNKIWIESLIPQINKLDSLSSELTKLIKEYRHGDIQTKYTEYDLIKESIIHQCNWKK